MTGRDMTAYEAEHSTIDSYSHIVTEVPRTTVEMEPMRLFLLYLTLGLQCGLALRILIYSPVYVYSPVRFMESITNTLVEAGHDVTEIRPIVDRTWNATVMSRARRIVEVDVDPRVDALVNEMIKPGGSYSQLWESHSSPMALFELMKTSSDLYTYVCEHIIFDSSVIDDLRAEKFDVGFTEAFDFCGPGVLEAIGVKAVISTSSSILLEHQAKLLGIPLMPSYVPASLSGYSEKMSFVERAVNGFDTFALSSLFLVLCDRQTELFRKKFGKDFPHLRELTSRSALFFTNANPYLDFPRPTLPKEVYIGGVAVKPSGMLEKEWDTVLNRKKRTVLISFGSVALSSEMSPAGKQSILRTVSNFPDVQFIWKYEGDDLSNLPENLFIRKWTPQRALLADGRISLFVTHAGMACTTEVAFSGTPAIVVPIFGDQHRNAKMLERHGSAVAFDKFDLVDSEKLSAVVRRMLEDQSYTKRAKHLAGLLNNTPFTPQELVVRNVEFVARFGQLPQLDPYGRRLSFVEYFLLDVLAVLLFAISMVLYLLYLIIRKVFAVYLSQSRKTKTD